MDRDLTQWAVTLGDTLTFDYPPDLTARHPDGVECWATYPGRLLACTRRDGHTGRHAAGTGDRIVAVWP